MTLLLRLIRNLSARRWCASARGLLQAALLVSPRNALLLRELVALTAKQRDARALLNSCRRLLAACPDDEHARETLAALELATGRVDTARKLLEKRAQHTPDDVPRLRLVEDALIDPERARRDGVYVALLRDVEVETSDWAILDGEKVYNSEAHNRALRKCAFVQGRASPDNKTFLFKLPPISRALDEACVHLGGDHNYCHWITRNLIKLALLEGTPYAELPLLINEDLRRHQREYLDLLGIPDRRLIKLPRPSVVRCRELVVPTSLTNHVKMGIGTQWLRRQLAPWIESGPPTERLFVSRRDATVRRLLNESELEAALIPLGFSSIVPGEMSVREQIRRFSRAQVIVGAHGAAFANLVFAPAGTQVVEINSTHKSHIPDFTFLARIAGLGFVSVISEDYDFTRPERYGPDTDFRVDVGEVLATLRRARPGIFS